jgi:DnaJ-domain-containing protein 1
MIDNEVKRQHYVPRTYLKHFSTERSGEYYINAVPKEDCRVERIIELNISNVCLQKDLYTLPGKTVEDRLLIEKFYSENIEAHYDQIYDILINPAKKSLNDSERELIISTVVIMLYRTTKWISIHNELLDRVLEQSYAMCQQTGNDYFMFEEQKISIVGKTLEQLKKENKDVNRPAQILTQLKVALQLINIRVIKDGIYVSKLIDNNDELITSDNPVVFINIKSGLAAPFDPNNILELPLNNKHILFLMPNSESETKNLIVRHNISGEMNHLEKLTYNHEQFVNSERFILGTNSSLKGFIKTKDLSDKLFRV